MPRLAEIHANLLDRLQEAKEQGWLGEVEGLEINLAGTEEKLAQLDEQASAAQTVTHLGLPTFRPRPDR
ncbi:MULTISPECIES: hypothetical protein [unclassified Streptomyces]|uniref:hypothetical protein n=1 Tax=unclassified Streptomyces TaxID=2593676 RepID=UPI002E1F5952|nr:hypothetical protein OG217_00030 [Streptomyces sp. NBC_01023]WSV01302.1 hypothetical protein OG217_36800 [Streptomyces sp. NBC_01023]